VAGHTQDCTADCLPEGNWLVVGACLRTQLVRDVGGWRDFPVYEDWDLFLRCHKAGATFELVRDAVYRAHVRTDSRNRGPNMEFKNRVHHQIVQACL
jgi:GT2 family glycosyltransferase